MKRYMQPDPVEPTNIIDLSVAAADPLDKALAKLQALDAQDRKRLGATSYGRTKR